VNRRRLIPLALGLLMAPGLVACSGDDKDSAPPTPPRPKVSTTTTSRPDYTQIAVPGIGAVGATTTTRPRQPGTAAIAGKVIDDQGKVVPGAFIRATYYANPDAPEVLELLSAQDGTYRFGNLYGGSWRIRAWQEPYLATLEAPDFFLSAGEQKAIDLKVKVVPDLAVTHSMAPNPPLLGWGTELAVKVLSQIVDNEGLVKRTAVVGTDVTLSLTNGWSILKGTNPVLTDEKGEARWELTCSVEGGAEASVSISGGVATFPFNLLSCLSPASTTTTTTAPPASSTSSTARRRSTTTTTRPKSTVTTKPAIKPR
jgi:hypothetical protein